jgi:hypothetical protein
MSTPEQLKNSELTAEIHEGPPLFNNEALQYMSVSIIIFSAIFSKQNEESVIFSIRVIRLLAQNERLFEFKD